jgi:hypothetical protein
MLLTLRKAGFRVGETVELLGGNSADAPDHVSAIAVTSDGSMELF